MRHLFAALALSLFTLCAHASEDPIRAELIDGWVARDGSYIAGLRLTLAPGWKTYWRAPGDAGIPPQFGWRGSRNLRSVAVEWPTPKVFGQNGMRSIGYHDQVVLPLRITPQQDGKPVEMRLSLDLGVCHKVCLPKTIKLRGTLRADAGKPVGAIAAALAARPFSGSEIGAGATRCTLKPSSSGGLEITAQLALPPTGGKEFVVIEADNKDIWISETDVSRSGNMLMAVADLASMRGGSFALDRSTLRFTVLGRDQAVELRGCQGS